MEHTLRVPLAHPGGPGRCQWKPFAVHLCVGPRRTAVDPPSCRPLYLVRDDGGPPKDRIDLTCAAESWSCTSSTGDQPQLVSEVNRVIQLTVRVTN